MRAKVTKQFHGWDEAKDQPEDFKVNAEIEGNIAYQAVSAGYAEWIVKPNDAELNALRGGIKPKYPPRPLDDGKAKGKGGGKGEGLDV